MYVTSFLLANFITLSASCALLSIRYSSMLLGKNLLVLIICKHELSSLPTFIRFLPGWPDDSCISFSAYFIKESGCCFSQLRILKKGKVFISYILFFNSGNHIKPFSRDGDLKKKNREFQNTWRILFHVANPDLADP